MAAAALELQHDILLGQHAAPIQIELVEELVDGVELGAEERLAGADPARGAWRTERDDGDEEEMGGSTRGWPKP